MVFTHPLRFKSSSPWTKPLVTVLSAPITIGITVMFMFHSFFSSLTRSKYLSLFSSYFSFSMGSARTAKSTIQYIFWSWLLLGLVVWPRLDNLFVSQNPREFCASHFLGCAYTICLYGPPCKFFTPALDDGVSMKFDSQQVFSSLQDCDWAKQYCSLDDLSSSFDFQLFSSSFSSLWGPFQACKLQLVLVSTSCSTAFLVLS